MEIIASPFSIYCELAPVYLQGEFNLSTQEKGWKVTNTGNLHIGSWKDQGMPFYPFTVSYKKSFNVNLAGEYIIKLPEWKGTVAEIIIDGEHRGIIYTNPYEYKVDFDFALHEIEIIVNGSNKNLLGPHHNVTQRGIVTPWSFKYAPKVQPPGNEYDQLDYGLMKDFEVFLLKN